MKARMVPVKSEAEERRARPIRVMISSRNQDLIPHRGGGTVSLLDVRKELLEELEEDILCGQHILQVWINERAGGQAGNESIWEKCREELRDAHVIIVIYNGQAGWQRTPGGLGICHEEVKYAFDHFPSKLRLIKMEFASSNQDPKSNPALELVSPALLAERPHNQDFAQFMGEINVWQAPAFDDESLKAAVRLAVANSVSELSITGSREGRKGIFYHGAPLGWARLSYEKRKTEIEKAVKDCLLKMQATPWPKQGKRHDKQQAAVVWELSEPVLLLIHGVPASFGVAEARELVGRPYLFDHTVPAPSEGKPFAGPVHLIACHKSCTESQVFSFMGHPDVYIVQTPFGFFAADMSNFVQAFFLTGCRDRDATVMAIEHMFEWIAQADEARLIVARATSRQRILKAIRTEIKRFKTISRRRPGRAQAATPLCPNCKGEGQVACTACNGSGSIEIIVPDPHGWDGERRTWEDCPACQGEREIDCPECKGTGTLAETPRRAA